MHFSLNLLFALLASTALAAPTPKQTEQKASHHANAIFKVPSRARPDNAQDIDTNHEMSRALAKFNFDLTLPSEADISTTIKSLPDAPEVVSDILNDIFGAPTKGPKPKSSTVAAIAYAPPYYSPASSYVPAPAPVITSAAPIPESTTPVSIPDSSTALATTSTDAFASVAADTSSVNSEPDSTTSTAEPYVPESESTLAASPSSTAQEPSAPASIASSAVPESSTPASSATVESSAPAAITSAASEPTAPAAESSASTPESTTPALVTSATPESTTSDLATSAAPEFTASATESSASAPITTTTTTPEASTEPVSNASSSTDQPSFSFAPTTTESTPSSTLATSTTKKVAATVTTTPEQNDSEFLAPVTIGGQPLNLNFDTGSADLWVFSNKLSTDQTNGHLVFDTSKSSTWQPADGYSWKISYGDGSTASGDVGFDAVTIGGATATRQAVELATQVSDTFAKDVDNDGLVGLGWSNINTIKPTQQKTFFENIMSELDQPLFTADLRQDATGSYEFGTIDAAKYSGDIHYTSIDNSKGFWQFPSTSYSINGQTYQNANAAPAIADTGTSIILADSTAVAAYYNQVQGATVSKTAGGYIFPCDAKLPDYGVAIGDSGFIANIPGASLLYADLKDGTCFGGIQSNTGINYQIFGDVLLKQYFAVFNGGAKTFGIANKA